ncbi:16S rRNA (guanine(966)-N(2))-methyltransferase RsmD [Megamonas sp.]
MRIITGSARGAKLKAPKGQNTRPTADRIKESLFNILGAFVYDKKVLDMFSGTGNLALEALSRGACHAVMVDTAQESIAAIKFNAQHTKLLDKAEILKADIFAAVKKFHQKKLKFDIIFCDPPYHKNLCLQSLKILHEYPVLNSGGLIIMEHATEDVLPDSYEEFSLLRRQKYGSTTQISIYKTTVKSEE